ncbi:sporulation/spore germination protein [Nodularia chucula]|uniref:sporulation/spore germination protein n=1 Tax=Nodularia chucula TaxID=3093667 RepID=UPI0039C63409
MINKNYILSFIILAIALSSCSSNVNSGSGNIDSETAQPSGTLTTPPTTLAPTKETPTVPTANVTLYTSDSQCQTLIPQPVSLPATETITAAIGKIIEQQDTSDFDLSGYRIQIENGIATVDLRRSPESQRQFVSLSSCEQFALFGSLRKTLISNTEWEIKDVRFTEQGQEIII